MKPLRAYLFVRRGIDDWDTTVHRDLESLMDTWRAYEGSNFEAVVHVGFWRPDTAAFEKFVSKWRNLVLITASARYALPPTCKVAPCQACDIDGLPLYVALSGWGYETTAKQVGLDNISDGDPGQSIQDHFKSKIHHKVDWFTFVARDDCDLAEEARTYSIVDEGSYLCRERELPAELRERLGWQRFVHNSGGPPNPANILDNLRFAPPWLLAQSIFVLDLSIRPTNCMACYSINTIEELASLGEAAILKFANLGRKSLREISEKVVRVFEEGPSNPVLRSHSKTTEPVIETADSKNLTVTASLENVFAMGLALLGKEQARLMRLRMGFTSGPKTLQEIGDEFHVTRERIRQIEKKCIKKMAGLNIWKNELEGKLGRVLTDRSTPLPLLGLEILDPWFINAEHLECQLEYVLYRLCEGRFSLVRLRGQTFVSRLTQIAWDEAVKKGRLILETEAGRNAPESEVRNTIDALLVGAGEELRPELWTETTRWANFATPENNNGERILVSLGYGAENIIEAILTEADRPLHYTELAKRCSERGRRPIDLRRVHNSAANVGLLLGRGVYGLAKHLLLSESELRLLVAEAEDIVEGGPANKQWHAREIAEAIEERGFDFGGKLTHYVVSIALERSIRLANLKRMVWALRSTGARGTANRIDVHQAIVSLLMTEGRPMPSEEIKARIAQDRGLGYYFQINPEGPLVRMGNSLWGLANRDLPFSESDGEVIVDRMVSLLRARGKGLHVTQIHSAIEPLAPKAVLVNDPALFLGLAQRSNSVAVAKGQYIYLPEWGGSRCMTIMESVKNVLEMAGPEGLTLDKGLAAAELLLERPLNRQTFGATCNNLGAVYDETTAHWSLPLDEETDNDEVYLVKT